MKKRADAMREFYSVIKEIRDLYENHGFLKQKSLYNEMTNKYNWKMTYKSFTIYFNKEIKQNSKNNTNTHKKNKEEIGDVNKIQNNNTIKTEKTEIESEDARLKAEIIADMNAYGEKQKRIKEKIKKSKE